MTTAYTFEELFILWAISNGFNTYHKIARRAELDKAVVGDTLATLANNNIIKLVSGVYWVIL